MELWKNGITPPFLYHSGICLTNPQSGNKSNNGETATTFLPKGRRPGHSVGLAVTAVLPGKVQMDAIGKKAAAETLILNKRLFLGGQLLAA